MIELNLKDLEYISDKEKIEKFIDLLDYTIYLKRHFDLNKNIKNDFNGEVKKQVAEKFEKEKINLLLESTNKKTHKIISKLKKDLLDANKRIIELKNLEKSKPIFDEIAIETRIINKIAKKKIEDNPLYGLHGKKLEQRAIIYKRLMESPEKSNKELSNELGVSEITISKALNELIATGGLLSEKIDFIKEVVVRDGALMVMAQQRIAQRLSNTDKEAEISVGELVSILKVCGNRYSMLVGDATDKKGGILKKQDKDLLDSVLAEHYGLIPENDTQEPTN